MILTIVKFHLTLMLLTSNVVTAAEIVINNHCYLLVAMAKSYKKKSAMISFHQQLKCIQNI